MAKKPRAQDPADAALSAIEEALSLGASDNDGDKSPAATFDETFDVKPEARPSAQPKQADRQIL
eukprot:gene56614-75600_t